ncbi:type II secretion system F family protein [Paenibacillus koleovorans]|uniref:type II secretion system F family protein n=1 Tax=Paenibacillus koleovorans TaxID=121608 RepID=UPI000FDA7487|nr:type II secretion system F family protein [Paenibacillus koleovorans]
MILSISCLTFLLVLLYLLPLDELFPTRHLRNTVNVILSHKPAKNMANSPLLKLLVPLLNRIARLIKIDPYAPKWRKYRDDLQVANLEHLLTLEQLISIKYLVSVAIFIYTLLLLALDFSIEVLLLAVVLVFLGYFLPDQWLTIRVKKRRGDIQKELPSILISLAVTTDAGLTLFQALEEICHRKQGALTDEIKKTLQEISVGIPQKEAFQNMADRVLVEELTLFVSALIQTLEKGSSGITQVLREQATEAWSNRKSRAKELGEKASIKLFMPLIGLILPALMIFLLSPAIFAILKFFVY